MPCPSHAATSPAITTSATIRPRSALRRSRPSRKRIVSNSARSSARTIWSFEAAGWCFIGLNSLVMNSGLAFEAEQFDWLASEVSRTNGKPVALFVHKPVFLNGPDDPEAPETSIRYVPQPARARLIEMFAHVDLRLIASGHVHQRRDFTWRHTRHVWAPSAGFKINDACQDRIAIKEVGLVEYRFQPDGFEVRHVRAAGQVDIDIEELLAQMGGAH
ncbi:hypothetical protein ACVWWO_009031 [Bradyrhizobium sp. F1.13.1]